MTVAVPERLALLDRLRLSASAAPDEADPAGGEPVSVLQAAAWLAGEPVTDTPECVSPVLAVLCRGISRGRDTAAMRDLGRVVPHLVGTAGDGQDDARRHLAADWLVRVHAPAWLRTVPHLADQATLLEGLPPLRGPEDLPAAWQAILSAASHATLARQDVRDGPPSALWAAAGLFAGAAVATGVTRATLAAGATPQTLDVLPGLRVTVDAPATDPTDLGPTVGLARLAAAEAARTAVALAWRTAHGPDKDCDWEHGKAHARDTLASATAALARAEPEVLVRAARLAAVSAGTPWEPAGTTPVVTLPATVPA